jgi:hypothetical protein
MHWRNVPIFLAQLAYNRPNSTQPDVFDNRRMAYFASPADMALLVKQGA